MNRTVIVAVSSAILFLLLTLLLSSPLEKIEHQLLETRYQLRGEIPADTNIVILYFDNDDIAALGGWPLRRNYYALLIDVLHQAGAAAIGIDVFFGERNHEYPEYDALLASTISKAGNVVLSSYFRSIDTEQIPSQGQLLSDAFYLKQVKTGLFGWNLQAPYDEFAKAAVGIGHINLLNGGSAKIPIFLRDGSGALPSFSLELLRIYFRVSKEDMQVAGRLVRFDSAGHLPLVPFQEDGGVTINFPGSLASFRSYRCVEVLQSYQLKRSAPPSSLDLSSFSGKVVLIGVIGEGRSSFIQTPYTTTFPPIGIHAAALDNALNSRFLLPPNELLTSVLALVITLLAVVTIMRFREGRGMVIVLSLLLLYVALSQVLFVSFEFILPIVKPFLVLFGAAVVTIIVEHRSLKNRMNVLESQKESAESSLRELEQSLKMLERELLEEKIKTSPSRRTELADEIRRYKQEIKRLSDQVADMVEFQPPGDQQHTGPSVYEGIVYDGSGMMKEVIDMTEKIASSETNVMILGESGTGKELVARAVHNRSSRREKQFVAVNCGAIAETLLESELFGHEKGAFTGAVKDKVGRFEVADGGTIFLDEIAETSEAFQVKLLRVIQEGEFERVGSSGTRKVNTRVIAATNKNIKELVRQKKFREDLFYRLNVFSLEVPSLRERRSDIPILTEYFLSREHPLRSVSNTVMDALLLYDWPGNVRELESALKRASIMAKSEARELIQLKDLPEAVSAALAAQIDIEDQILDSLRTKRFSRRSISETATELGGLNRGTVAEYFRGICFRIFFENGWDRAAATAQLAATDEKDVTERVEKKLTEYLTNIVDGIDKSQDFDDVKRALKSKYKNLPQRYHGALDDVIRAYLDKEWK